MRGEVTQNDPWLRACSLCLRGDGYARCAEAQPVRMQWLGCFWLVRRSEGASCTSMNTRVRTYVVAVTVAAGAVAWILYSMDPLRPSLGLGALIVLCTLALISETLAFLLPNTIYSSVAFIPYLTAVLLVPNWTALVGVLVVRVVMEITSRRTPETAVFNVAQQAITFSAAVIVFRLAGGENMFSLEGQSLSYVTLINGLPTLAAFVASFAINSSLVSGHVSAKSQRSFSEVWRDTHQYTISVDILASPIVFLFAWVYVNWGWYAAAALWVPVLGLRQLQKSNLDLERYNSELLELMVKSMEARDPYTSGHSRRVQQYSVAIARGLGLGPAEIDKVSRAALLHDVGKIHEKYAPLLRKPGKLTPEEWQMMQKHPTDGAELVSTMTRLQDIVPAIKHHHERWDGTGYPLGLAGETIPLQSRIIAFADTMDAMTSERPYRRTLSEDEVRAEIVRCRGTQFDPGMTDQILSAATWRLIFSPMKTPESTPSLSILPRSRLASRA
jgi:putative nucleotidyltransferase with HDIG domain